MNILITSCSKKVLLVKSFKKICNNFGGKILCTDINLNSPALYYADDYFLSPKLNDNNYFDFIINNCNKYKIKLLIPTRCGELEYFSKNKNVFKEKGIIIMICSLESLEICQNKNVFFTSQHEAQKYS